MAFANMLRSGTSSKRYASMRLFSSTRLSSQVSPLDFSKLTISKTQTPKELPPPEELVFGKTFTGKSLMCID